MKLKLVRQLFNAPGLESGKISTFQAELD